LRLSAPYRLLLGKITIVGRLRVPSILAVTRIGKKKVRRLEDEKSYNLGEKI